MPGLKRKSTITLPRAQQSVVQTTVGLKDLPAQAGAEALDGRQAEVALLEDRQQLLLGRPQ